MDNSYIGAEIEENDLPMEIESDMSGIVKDYDVLKNKPTIDGNAVYGDITRSGRYTDEIPTDGSKKLLTSGDAKKALDAKSDQDHTHGEYLKKEDVPEIPSVPENVSAFNNDVGYVTESEMDAALSQKSDASHTHGEYLKKEDVPEVPRVPENLSAFNNDVGYVTGSEMDEVLSEKSDTSHTHPHNHDERYYTKDNVDSMLEGSAMSGHNHDSRYYTEEETDSLLSGKSDTSHTHGEYLKKEEMPEIPSVPENVSEFTNDARYVTDAEMHSALSGKSDTSHTHPHNHDDLYSKKTDFSGLQKDVAANSSSIVDIQNECDSLEEQLGSVEQKQNTQALSLQLICSSMEQMADIVVDEGTFGEWTYRKWESGIAECWGNIACNHSNAVGKGSNYRFAVDYPFMFAKTPLAFIHPSAMAYKVKKTYPLAPTDTNNKAKLTIFVLLEEDAAVGAGETNSFYVNVKGNWK